MTSKTSTFHRIKNPTKLLNQTNVLCSTKQFLLTFLIVLFTITLHANAAHSVSRIKDITEFEGVRDNMLVGYGLVVGLNGTGEGGGDGGDGCDGGNDGGLTHPAFMALSPAKRKLRPHSMIGARSGPLPLLS